MENRILQLFLRFCWAMGYLPSMRPSINSPNFRFKATSFSAGFSFFLFLSSTAMSFVVSSFIYANRKRMRSQVEQVVLLGCGIIRGISYSAIRATSLIYGARLIKMVKDLDSVSKHDGLRQYAPVKTGMNIWKSMLAASIVCVLGRAVPNVTIVRALVAPSTVSKSPFPAVQPSLSFQYLFQLGVAICTTDVLVAQAIATGFILVMGMTLSKSHSRFMGSLKDQLSLTSVTTKSFDMRIETMKTFHKLVECFDAFRNIIGIFGMAEIVLAMSSVIYNVFFFIWPGHGAADGATLVYTMLDPLLIVYSGTVIENQVKMWKKRLNERILEARLSCTKSDSKDFLVPEAVVRWKWDFSAGDIFSINNALIPTLLGAMATCLTFIIQLEISESAWSTTGSITNLMERSGNCSAN